MNMRFILLLLSIMTLTASAQNNARLTKARSLKKYAIPAGNYSGITRIADSRYAVCDDKTSDGFYVWDIRIDSVTGKILDVKNEGFRASGAASRDAEDIAYHPDSQTIYMVSEHDNRIYAYTPDGTQLLWTSPVLLSHSSRNTGLEGLTYDAQRQCLWAMEENDGTGHSLLVNIPVHAIPDRTVDSSEDTYIVSYTLAPSVYSPPLRGAGVGSATHVYGVSALCATDDGRLLVLEREAFVPKKKIGAWVLCRLYAVCPEIISEKQLVASWKTRLNFTARSWANYEGMCLGPRLCDGRQVLLLISDSQNRYGGVLQDRIRTLILP